MINYLSKGRYKPLQTLGKKKKEEEEAKQTNKQKQSTRTRNVQEVRSDRRFFI